MKNRSLRIYLPTALALMILCCPAFPARGEEIIAPTCTQDGYALMRHPDGTVTARRYMPASGHTFGHLPHVSGHLVFPVFLARAEKTEKRPAVFRILTRLQIPAGSIANLIIICILPCLAAG